ncbi:hypothetical protein TCAL_14315 [Tigriopus californicus]|uniref:SWIM-type domain-containing protein n=1 Tax=Tigriopus californicus TaxID=6832 RepID=A0A553NCT8_TIGCA|nr:zinc finger SWIM domain-containing protein 7-like [Tigriopus californicus]TRY63263.1 hypothetical protein TCAL_14315 [Tigriopus californicus]
MAINCFEAPVIQALLGEVKDEYSDQESLSPQLLLRLASFFTYPLLSSTLDMLDTLAIRRRVAANHPDELLFGRRSRIVRVTPRSANDGRDSHPFLWQVWSTSGLSYVIYPGTNYCPCESWQYLVWRKGLYVTCKHVLGVAMGLAMNLIEEREVDSVDFVMLSSLGE